MRSDSSAVAKLWHYSWAMLGPVSSAGIQFLLSLVLLRKLEPAAFGSFSFLLVASQFSWGIWGALFCAPLPVIIAAQAEDGRSRALRTLLSANLLGSVLAFFIFLLLSFRVGLESKAAILYSGYCACSLLRWLARTYAYASGAPRRAAFSDLTYGAVLALGVGAISIYGDESLTITWAALTAGTCLGFLPFGIEYLRLQFASFEISAVRRYGNVWREHARWSLLGVVSTEATANSHVYIITLFRGPMAFAPLAASSLLIRPIAVAMNALTEFERAKMARQVSEGDVEAVVSSARFFRLALIAIWIGTGVVTALLLAFKPGLVFPAQYSRDFLAVGAALWMAVALVRLLRMPESCVLQSAGEFRPLAFASIWSSIVSIISVVLLMWFVGPLWSILGILLGEAVFAGWIWRQTKNWLAAFRSRLDESDKNSPRVVVALPDTIPLTNS